MLQADDVDVAEVEEVGRPAIGVEILLGKLEAHFGRVVVAAFDVVDRRDDAVGLGILRGDRLAQVEGERRDAALPRQIIADEGDLANLQIMNHGHSFHESKAVHRSSQVDSATAVDSSAAP